VFDFPNGPARSWRPSSGTSSRWPRSCGAVVGGSA